MQNLPLSLLTIVLAAFCILGPFSIDFYLPAVKQVTTDLEATDLQLQQAMTIFMVGFAYMSLWHGALADSFGRRKVLIITMLVFSLASLFCAYTDQILWFWVGRFVQGLMGGAGFIVVRAIISDMFQGIAAQKLMARVMMVFSLAPAIAPILGGHLFVWFGWRSLFWFLCGMTAILAMMAWVLLRETLPPNQRRPFSPSDLLSGYLQIFANIDFLLLSIAIGTTFNGFFSYVLASPHFIIDLLHMAPTDFGWFFVPVTLAGMLGYALNEILGKRMQPLQVVIVGFVIMLLSVVMNLLVTFFLPANPLFNISPVVVFMLGMGIESPCLILFVMELFPQRRGMVSSCQTFVQILLNVLSSGLVVPLLWSSVFQLAIGMTAYTVTGTLAFLIWWWRRYRRMVKKSAYA